jgi:hypothetical protein
MIKKIWKKLFPSKESLVDSIVHDMKSSGQVFESVIVPKEYLEVLESLHKTCRPLTFCGPKYIFTEDEAADQRMNIRLRVLR